MSGPLAPFAEEYRLELMARGYTVRSAVNELRQVARLSRWLEDRGRGARDLSREQIEEFLAFQRRSGRLRSQSRPGLLCLLGVLQARGVAVEPAAPLPSARELLLSSFERYLLVERGLARPALSPAIWLTRDAFSPACQAGCRRSAPPRCHRRC